MTPYDGAMAGVIVAGMIWGAFKGITWQLASILSLVLGYSVAHPLSAQFAPYFPGEPVVARFLAMIAVYVAVACGVFLIAWSVRATLRRLQFEAFDRHLGMILGGVEGALLGLVATLFVVSLAPQTRDPVFNSPTGRVVGQVMSVLGPVLPAEARGVLAPFWKGSAADEGRATRTIAEGEIPDRQSRAASAAVVRPTPADADVSPASLSDLVEESERRIGRAVIDGATDTLRRTTNGGNGNVRK